MLRRPPRPTLFPSTTLFRSTGSVSYILTDSAAKVIFLESRRSYDRLRYVIENSKSLQYIVLDRKSTRLNSSHANMSYAVFCLKKNKHGYAHEAPLHRRDTHR